MKIAFFRPPALAAAFLLAGLSACQSTTLQSAWKAPEVGSIHFTKIIVIGIAPVDSMRKPVEDAMKAQITAVPAVASYELLPNVADQVDPKKLRAAITAAGIDGIITMRMLSLADKVTYSPGGMVPVPYQSFYGYYAPGYALAPYYRGMPGSYYGAPVAYEYVPPSETRDVLMNIETNIYDARDGKLIWSGRTQSTNPSKSDNLIAEIAGVVRAKLHEQRLIP
jgi:hypothetical protein